MFYIIIWCQGLHFGCSMNWGHHPTEKLQLSRQSCRWCCSSGRDGRDLGRDGQGWGQDGRGCPKNLPSFAPPLSLHHPHSRSPYQLNTKKVRRRPRCQHKNKRKNSSLKIKPSVKRVWNVDVQYVGVCVCVCLVCFLYMLASIAITYNYMCIYQQQKQ